MRQWIDQIPRATFISWVIVLTNVAVWLAMEAAGGSTNARVLLRFGVKVNALVAEGQYWRLFTAMFLHIGLTHLVFNMIGVLSYGRITEMIFGHARFAAIYVVGGLAGSMFSYLFGRYPSAGASGAIVGVAGALAMFYALHRRAFPVAQGQLVGLVVVLFGIIGYGLVQPGIDNWGHLGGLVGGLVMGAALAPRLVVVTGPEGAPTRIERRPSPAQTWLAVPAALAIIAIIVAAKTGG
ncbi:MAG TPA: rhomboid family intramembrane serine protease [Chloroflexota bacterium]|nr:rhomboid family intramembrane serine protease [Chloroflexota bacterium]